MEYAKTSQESGNVAFYPDKSAFFVQISREMTPFGKSCRLQKTSKSGRIGEAK